MTLRVGGKKQFLVESKSVASFLSMVLDSSKQISFVRQTKKKNQLKRGKRGLHSLKTKYLAFRSNAEDLHHSPRCGNVEHVCAPVLWSLVQSSASVDILRLPPANLLLVRLAFHVSGVPVQLGLRASLLALPGQELLLRVALHEGVHPQVHPPRALAPLLNHTWDSSDPRWEETPIVCLFISVGQGG